MNRDHTGCLETMVHSKAVQDITFQRQTILNSASHGAACVAGHARNELKQLMMCVVQNLSKTWSLFSLGASAQWFDSAAVVAGSRAFY